MHTPIGVKPVAGSKEWREAWQKRAFAHISNGYKHIYIMYLITIDISSGFLPHKNLRLQEQGKIAKCSFSYL